MSQCVCVYKYEGSMSGWVGYLYARLLTVQKLCFKLAVITIMENNKVMKSDTKLVLLRFLSYCI